MTSFLLLGAFLFASSMAAQENVNFATTDGGTIQADIYGKGERGLVLAHGGRFNKDSWAKQIPALTNAGFKVLAFNFRGYGLSAGPGQETPLDAPLHNDVLAAVRYLKKSGARSVSILGGSMGAGAALNAATQAEPGEIDRLAVLGWGTFPPENLKGRKLFVIARDDLASDGTRRLDALRKYYEKVPEPKKLEIIEGSAHAQFIFETDQSEKVLKMIIDFLSDRDLKEPPR